MNIVVVKQIKCQFYQYYDEHNQNTITCGIEPVMIDYILTYNFYCRKLYELGYTVCIKLYLTTLKIRCRITMSYEMNLSHNSEYNE